MLTHSAVDHRVCKASPGDRRAARRYAARRHANLGLLILVALFLLAGCAQLAQAVTVTVTPSSAQVVAGGTQQFTATVTGSGNQVVTWSVSGTGCAGVACGTISGGGFYTAPVNAPNPPSVTVKATSLADSSASGTAAVQIVPPAPVKITISPTSVTLGPGQQQQFSAVVTGSKDTQVIWNAIGTGCIGFNCGTISLNGLYTAPAQIPSPPTITVTATSHADSSKVASATVTLAVPVVVTVSPSNVQLLPGQQQQFKATVTGTNNTAVNWSISGAGCTGAACGTISGSGLYTAPGTVPTPPNVTVTAVSVADPTKSGTATVNLIANIAVTVTPSSVHVSPGKQQQFTAVVSGTNNQRVTWNLSGTGCTGITCGQITATGLYTAPTNIPNPNTVTVSATSAQSPDKVGTATVFVGANSPVVVTVSPSSANVVVGQTQQFTAQVTGTNNTNVTWSVSGVGCSGASCGSITQSGLYTAPASPPTPSGVTITATSQADPTRSGTATANILPNVVVTISPTQAQVQTGKQVQFTATVTGSKNTNVTWSVSGKGCGGNSCGTVTQTGLYTAPAQVPNPPQVSVTATAQADPTKSASAAVTILTPIKVTVAPPTAQVVINATQQFVATVTGTSDTAVTWSLSGSSCPNACGTIDSSGLYTAPGTVPNSNVTVTATSHADGKSSGTAIVQVIPKNESKLNGQFAFLFRGTDASGFYQAAGSFVADGQGNILSGVEDINRTSGPVSNLPFTGTYSMHGDNRGLLTLTSGQGTSTYAFALGSNLKRARMTEVDNSSVRGTGVIEKQDPTVFNNGGVSGGYTLNLIGADSRGQRIGALASIFPSGGGFISGSSMDVNEGGSSFPTFINFAGSYGVSGTGRGTLTLLVPGFGAGTFNFVIYVVSSSEFLMVSSDSLSSFTPLFGGTALLQSGAPFSSATFNGKSIFVETGITNGAPDVSVGLLTFDGHGTINMQVDENAGGAVQIGTVFTGAYAVSLNGRTVLNLVNAQTHVPSTATMYAISPNAAYIMDASGSVRSGYLEPQLVVPPFGDADMVGNYTFGSSIPVGANTPVVSGVLNFDGNGNVAGNQDEDLASGPVLNQLTSGTYAVSPSSQNGRGVIQFTVPQAQTIAIWVATYSRAYGIPVGASDVAPSVLVFEQ